MKSNSHHSFGQDSFHFDSKSIQEEQQLEIQSLNESEEEDKFISTMGATGIIRPICTDVSRN
jgi:hypothetical protein